MNNSSHGHGFMNGFLLGAILGGAAVFLLGTKKGKNILKLISEESFELSELFGGDTEMEEEEIVDVKHEKCEHCQKKQAEYKTESTPVEYETNSEESENIPHSNGGSVSKITNHGRRFFRIPKKS
ncbi:MAG: YtxH domain-containing protein [Candidatus Levybacteria bacterium]|nr:YtxH domain-containing protein [Candidatus Levybacteria bacterium]